MPVELPSPPICGDVDPLRRVAAVAPSPHAIARIATRVPSALADLLDLSEVFNFGSPISLSTPTVPYRQTALEGKGKDAN